MKSLLKVAGAIVLLAALLVGSLKLWQTLDEPGLADFVGVNKSSVLVGQTAPPFKLPRVGGGEVSLADYRGKTVILLFWATWCPSCREAAPVIHDFADGRDDVVVLAASIREDDKLSPADLDAAILKEIGGYSFIGFRGDQGLAQAYSASAIPNVVIIDGEGVVRYTGIGFHSQDALREAIEG